MSHPDDNNDDNDKTWSVFYLRCQRGNKTHALLDITPLEISTELARRRQTTGQPWELVMFITGDNLSKTHASTLLWLWRNSKPGPAFRVLRGFWLMMRYQHEHRLTLYYCVEDQRKETAAASSSSKTTLCNVLAVAHRRECLSSSSTLKKKAIV